MSVLFGQPVATSSSPDMEMNVQSINKVISYRIENMNKCFPCALTHMKMPAPTCKSPYARFSESPPLFSLNVPELFGSSL